MVVMFVFKNVLNAVVQGIALRIVKGNTTLCFKKVDLCWAKSVLGEKIKFSRNPRGMGDGQIGGARPPPPVVAFP